ncbi:hypothetical protein ACFDTO_08260 [Microbacteriaceae bacterium 4G12]
MSLIHSPPPSSPDSVINWKPWTTDVTPAATHAFVMLGSTIVASVFVPGLSGSTTALWLLCRYHPQQPPSLVGSWGDRIYVGDDYGADPLRDLTVSGVPATAEELADLGSRWLELHLTMDIYRDEWRRGRWSKRDSYGFDRFPRKSWDTPTRSVLERSAGFATGRHWP